MTKKLTRKHKKTGRPTKYKPQYCQKIIEYFSVEHFEDKLVSRVTGKNDYKKEEFKETANPLPFITQFARKIGVATSQLFVWEKTYPEFREALTCARELQQEMLVSNAMKGLYQPHFTIFSAKNMIGWKDKTEIEHGATDELMDKYKDMSADELLKAEVANARAIVKESRTTSYN